MKQRATNLKYLLGLLFMVSLTLTSKAQFKLTTGYSDLPANAAGYPNLGKGTVQVRKAPPGTGSVNQIRNNVNNAGIDEFVKNELLNSRLVNGFFSNHIAQLNAVKNTTAILQNRRAVYNGGGIVISNNQQLNANRLRLSDNSTRTFIFRGSISVSQVISVGSNKTIWIDGEVRYVGPTIPNTGGNAFTPRGEKEDGLFRLRKAFGEVVNTKFFGTKRGRIWTGNRAPGIYIKGGRDITIRDIEFYSCYNAISYLTVFGQNNVIRNNFFAFGQRRNIHLKVANNVTVENNFTYKAGQDGIDIDAFSKNCNVRENLIVAGGNRFQIWIEIGSSDNSVVDNVGIHTTVRIASNGGMQENGSETGQAPTKNNTWTGNHVFYANDAFQGITMSPDRVIDRNSITFWNNYVWSEKSNATRHNPKPQSGIFWDVRYLTKNDPIVANGARTTTESAVALEEQETVSQLVVGTYPNPLKGNDLNVSFNLTDKTDVFISIFDLAGKVLYQKEEKNLVQGHNQLSIESSVFAQAGEFALLTIQGDGINERYKIVLQ
ncbi:MAG: right-handed parallel beta-helix repeat-containing protein [Bacteroidota bacterium]